MSPVALGYFALMATIVGVGFLCNSISYHREKRAAARKSQ